MQDHSGSRVSGCEKGAVLNADIQKPGKGLGYKPGAANSDLLVLPVFPLTHLRGGKSQVPTLLTLLGVCLLHLQLQEGRVNMPKGEADE